MREGFITLYSMHSSIWDLVTSLTPASGPVSEAILDHAKSNLFFCVNTSTNELFSLRFQCLSCVRCVYDPESQFELCLDTATLQKFSQNCSSRS